ncbi:Bug family tripartite tricarboxylate transporter substrate binding protein [Nocardiopsis ansamitocini]|uniref:C4-dicarboxylate ABC transporter substrate-binding protein n=1 Tax=Nocardiopsis ansamitocini TaxID=1670832 RepID=A0A9W6UH06_9ACTN|nr:tripartite tricarboxylate transporter substrate-binding protein [Nocardiopsis ansamitocini]GLU46232.1 C4-dicarboxylate ABC transporter substrate-binding protein [Nocardiopsis ansamitocini]
MAGPNGRLLGAVGGAVAVVLLATAVVDVRESAASGTGAGAKVILVAPAAPGGGWDMLARELQNGLRDEELRYNVQVTNVAGAGGTIGLRQTANREGQANVLTMTGLGMVGAVETTNSTATMDDVTPIAQLASEYGVVVVPADSPYETVDDFVQAWREQEETLPVAGGSMGGVDQIFAGLTAAEAGVDPGSMNYLPYSGGGEVLTSLLSNTSQAGFGTLGDFRDQLDGGPIRALGVSAPERIEGFEDIPTLTEQGYDVELANWRGVIAPPGLAEEEIDELSALVAEIVESPSWADTLERNRWTDTYQPRAEFESFLDEEIVLTREIVKELGF